jgi:hypothetical protein
MTLNRYAFLVVAVVFLLLPARAHAQTASPESIELGSTSQVCTAGQETRNVSLTLPAQTTTDKVDVLLLFDDTGSFANSVAALSSQFQSLVGGLEATFPNVEFGFGVARFEDYGGPGSSFSKEYEDGRPFTLNQPIITKADAGGEAARNELIANALSHTGPGFGGDLPETAVTEGLFQAATGAGFDGNGDGDFSDSGAAGEMGTQTSPGTSGDVPSFGSNTLPKSGTLGGAGWRADAQKIVILATDICSVASFDPEGSLLPDVITGTGSTEPISAFACAEAVAGTNRFGFVSDAKSLVDNTVEGATVPAGAATVQQAVDALNALGAQVVGIGPEAIPTASTDPAEDESVFLSAVARLTGAVDGNDNPLVVDLGGDLAGAITEAIELTTTAPIDVTLTTTDLPAGLSFAFTPEIVPDVAPGDTAPFEATFIGDGTNISGTFDIQFRNAASNALLGAVPTSVNCTAADDGSGDDGSGDDGSGDDGSGDDGSGDDGSGDDGSGSYFCARTPGYWKNHYPEAWPTTSLALGSETYESTELVDILDANGPDAATRLATHLTATKLNLLAGSDQSIQSVVDDADDFLEAHPPGSDPNGQARNEANAIKDQLDAYNNAGECDARSNDPTPDNTAPVCGEIEVQRVDGQWAVITSASDNRGITEMSMARVENLEFNYDAGDGFIGPYVEGDEITLAGDGAESIDVHAFWLDTRQGAALEFEVRDAAGNTALCDPVVQQLSASAPMAFELESSYPNPSPGHTAIEFRVAEPGPVTIEVFDITGRRVATLVDRRMTPGTYEVTWDGRTASGQRLASGVYLYRMKARDFTATRRMTIVK